MALTNTATAAYNFNESSGNPADSSGNANTLTNNGTTAFSSGLIGNCGDFGSANTTQSFSISSALGLTTTSTNTWIGWVNITTQPSANSQFLFDVNSTSGGNQRIVFWYLDTAGTKTMRAYCSGNNIDSATTLTTGTWFHLALTNNAGACEFFINGVSKGTQTMGTSGSGINVTAVGAASDNLLASNMNGKVDIFKVFPSVFSTADIVADYNAGVGLEYPYVLGPTTAQKSSSLLLMGV